MRLGRVLATRLQAVRRVRRAMTHTVQQYLGGVRMVRVASGIAASGSGDCKLRGVCSCFGGGLVLPGNAPRGVIRERCPSGGIGARRRDDVHAGHSGWEAGQRVAESVDERVDFRAELV